MAAVRFRNGFVNVASQRLGAAVMASSDAHFGVPESLLDDNDATDFGDLQGPRGIVLDGWETRRHSPDREWVILRLAVPAVIDSIEVDTVNFKTNHPESVSVDGAMLEGYPSPAEVTSDEVAWLPIAPRSACAGHTTNHYPSESRTAVSHLRLTIHPDGGIARLRVYGRPVADPRDLHPHFEASSIYYGAHVCEASYARPSADHILLPGPPLGLRDGWITRRRRGEGFDSLVLELAATCEIRAVHVDTRYYTGTQPQRVSVQGSAGSVDGADDWREVVGDFSPLPGTVHRFQLAAPVTASRIRLNTYPDGGIARLRVFGDIPPAARLVAACRWLSVLPTDFAVSALVARGAAAATAAAIVTDVAARGAGDDARWASFVQEYSQIGVLRELFACEG